MRETKPKTPLTQPEIDAVETLDAANPRDRVLLNLFHRLAFPLTPSSDNGRGKES